MSSEACVRGRIGREQAVNLSVREVMDAGPKTTPTAVTVGELRAAFAADSHLRSALLTDGDELVGTLERQDLPPDAASDELGAAYARRPAHVMGPDDPAAEALERLDASGEFRMIVVAQDGRSLLGLVCMDAKRSHFCVPTSMAPPAG